MANDLVVTLGARLDQFASDMNQAGDIADSTVGKIEQSFANLNPGINLSSLSTLVLGAAAGFSALLALVASLNKGLDDMAKQAERVGLSLERFQQLQFGAAALGVGSAQFGTDMEAFATNAQKALTTTNDLKRVLDANGVAVADANGKLKDTNDLFQHAVDIIKRAPTIADALQMGQFLGLSKEFAQAIFDAGDNFLKLAASANAAGAVIDDATIKKAQTFTTEWNKASALWGAQMKAATLEFLPLINDAIGLARTLMSYFSTALQGLSAVKDFALPTDVDTASIDKLQSMYDQAEKIQEKLASGAKLNPIELFQASNMQEDGEVTLASVDKYLALIADRILNFNKNPKNAIRVNIDTPSVNPGVKQPAEADDKFDTAIAQLQKRTATVKADTATTFQNAAAQAQMRAEFQLLNAIVEDDGEVTQKQLDLYEELRKSMSATQALQAAGITLTKEHSAAFADASKNIGAATAESIKARDSLQKLNSASQQLGSALSSAFADAIVDGKSLNDVMSSLIKTLEKAAINSVFANVFSAGAGGGASSFLKALGVGANAGGTDNWRGGLTMVGEQGPELVNLPRGSQVIPNDVVRNGAMGSGGTINYSPAIDARGASVDAVARLAQILAEDRATFTSRTVTTIQQARRGRVPGL